MILSLPYENEKRKPNSKDVFPFYFFFSIFIAVLNICLSRSVSFDMDLVTFIFFFWSFGESTKKKAGDLNEPMRYLLYHLF